MIDPRYVGAHEKWICVPRSQWSDHFMAFVPNAELSRSHQEPRLDEGQEQRICTDDPKQKGRWLSAPVKS